MRVFVAIELPEDIRGELATVQKELRPVSGSARWVAAEATHLTLKFIGEIAERRIDEIDRELSGLGWKPFTVTVQGVGFFPGTRSPRVLWAGLQAQGMEGLAERIDTRLERLGIEREKRAFRAHVTLARAKNTRLDTAMVQEAERFQDKEFGSFTADRCVLYQSILKPAGAVYVKLKEYLLSSSRDG